MMILRCVSLKVWDIGKLSVFAVYVGISTVIAFYQRNTELVRTNILVKHGDKLVGIFTCMYIAKF
jgi:hypothetical protein